MTACSTPSMSAGSPANSRQIAIVSSFDINDSNDSSFIQSKTRRTSEEEEVEDDDNEYSAVVVVVVVVANGEEPDKGRFRIDARKRCCEVLVL
mmetsp:Transcript_6281/g.8170  ORF Transcript_6281/g.8170 Transcript_6281/m.8170 type:complete len:93 (+) Transcript_6281:806-1084(+)